MEAVNHPTLLLTSILHALKVFEHLHMLWMMGILVHPYTLTPVQVGANCWKYGGWGKPKPPSCMVPCLEAVNHPTLYLRSILNVYEVFEPFHMPWMGIWVHPYTVTPVQVGAKFQILENWG